MRKIREILRLRHEQGLSHREMARACVIGAGTGSRYLQKTAERGLGWPLPAELDDTTLEARLFRRSAPVQGRARPDCAYIHRERRGAEAGNYRPRADSPVCRSHRRGLFAILTALRRIRRVACRFRHRVRRAAHGFLNLA